ncbi:MAG: DUF1552 domain-containing protein [Pirellulaceae bacterium]
MALPWLTSMSPALASPAQNESNAPRRFVAMTLGLGLIGDNLNPTEAGKKYKPSRYLKELQDLRDQVTVVSGSSHPGVKGGHRAEASILTATAMGSAGKAKNTISIDQYLAKHLGDATRFPSLVLSNGGSTSPSYTENGSMIPPEDSPSNLFAKLFIDDSPKERELQADRVRQGRSIMDLVGEDAKSLSRELGTGDQQRLDAYFTSVRDLEKRMAANERWAKLPKPKVDAKRPVDIGNGSDLIGRQRMMSDVIKLALQTDSSRYVTYHIPGAGGVIPIDGVDEGYHGLSHHGRDEEKLSQLALIETEMIKAWADLLRDLQSTNEANGSLLDNTAVFMTSNLGNSSNHDNRNMPVLLAGGGFRHGQHLAFDQKNNYPLPNLYVSILQRMGMPVDTFATSTGTMTGLEMV